MDNIKSIEMLRAVAVVLVVLMHATHLMCDIRLYQSYPVFGIFNFGHGGVDIFFVLSGFIIFYIHHKEFGNIEFVLPYLLKRVARIYPAYWIVMAFYFTILIFSPSQDKYEQSGWAVVSSLFIIHQDHQPILGVAWSLEHEMLFYIIFSVLIINIQIGRVIFGLWAAGIVINIFVLQAHSGIVGFIFRIFNIEFLFGIFVAYAILKWRIWRPGFITIIGVVVFFISGICELCGIIIQYEAPIHLTYSISSAMMLYGFVGMENMGRIRPHEVMIRLGASSYSIYLCHVIVIMLVKKCLIKYHDVLIMPRDAAFCVVVVVSISISVVFSICIEQPLLRWSRRRIQRWLPCR